MRLLVGFLAFYCGLCSTAFADSDLKQTVDQYFEVFAKRTDFEEFMGFYADDSTLEDVVFGFKASNKQEVAEFFDWSRGEFRLRKPGPILSISQQVISGSTVITSGEFLPFVYNGNELGPWQFVIWHEFDENRKIRSQQDWINYGPKKFLFDQAEN